MFNPQRKSKLVDIYQEQRTFQIHLHKMKDIQRSPSPLASVRNQSDNKQSKYLELISHRRHVDKERSKHKVDRQNYRIFQKLMEADNNPEGLPLNQVESRHSSHFYNQKLEVQRIRKDNSAFIERIVNKTSLVPSHSQMKKDFQQNKRYAKMVRKLPSIMKYEQKFKRDISMTKINQSRTSVTSSRKKIESERKPTHISQQIQKIESGLLIGV